MQILLFSLLAISLPWTTPSAELAADRAAIRETALNYIEGWYEGNAERMKSALHPQLAKRMVFEREGVSQLNHQTSEILVGRTASRSSDGTRLSDHRREVEILDLFGKAASVRVTADAWVDYLHVVKWNGHWLIINVLWELNPEDGEQ